MRRLLLPLCAALVASGCIVNVGSRAERLGVALAPDGTSAQIRLRGLDQVVSGELLEVRDDALVLLSTGRVTLVPFSGIGRATFDDTMIYAVGGSSLTPDEVAELRLISRYPGGISTGVMTALLTAHGQLEPRLIAR